jgi:phage tail sheath gpL-like
MSAPKAMASSIRSPGFYLLINLLAGASNPGTSPLLALLIAQVVGSGDITVDTEVRRCADADAVAVALGEGSPGHLAAIQMFAAYGSLLLDVVAPTAATGAAATITLTISGTPTDENQFQVDLAGRKSDIISWAVGESIATFRSRAIGIINAMRTDLGRALLPVTASAGTGGGDLDLDADAHGTWGNDFTVGITRIRGSGGVFTAPAANLSGGTGEFNITTALGSVAVTEYAAIGLATSNADATDATSSSNAERLQLHLEEKKSGLDALLQYGFIGHTGSIANVKAGAIGRNGVDMTYAYAQNAQSLPAELMGWELGDAMRWYQLRPSYNRIANPAPYILGAKSRTADKLLGTEREDLLMNGVTPYDFAPVGTGIVLVAPITTHSLDSGGNNDTRAYYQLETWTFNAVGRDLRTAVPQEFPNASITADLPANADALPEGVVERRDVYAFVVERLRSLARLGWLQTVYLEQVIASGELIVEIDEQDESQVNIFIPSRAVKPLAKFSGVIHKTG